MDYEKNEQKGLGIMEWISIALTILSVIMPFLNWIEVPIVAGLYSFFGMSSEPTKFSLFGYIFAGSNNQNTTVFLITLIIALIAFVGVILNFVYMIKAFKKAEKRYKYGTLGAVIMNIVSIMFIVIVGLTAVILKVIELTLAPYFMLAISIVNIIIIKNLKKNTKTGNVQKELQD